MKRLLIVAAACCVLGVLTLTGSGTASSSTGHVALNCARAMCAEVQNPEEVFGEDHYVGHDEPSLAFYSNRPGAGNDMTYSLRLPRDPSPDNPNTVGKSYQFELNGTFWLGMALCATQSYPEQVSTCAPDSDSNIVDPVVSPNHPGTAFVELQFYPLDGYRGPRGRSPSARAPATRRSGAPR